MRPLKIKNTRRINGVARPGVLCFLKSQELGRVLAALCPSFLGTGAEQLSAQLGQAKWSGGGRAEEALIINPLDKPPPVSSSCYKRKPGVGRRSTQGNQRRKSDLLPHPQCKESLPWHL